jgi:protein gp37
VWLGTSIENRRFVGRADALRRTPAAVRFISAEPLLGPLVHDAVDYVPGPDDEVKVPIWDDGYKGPGLDLTGIDWLIVGGESGPGFRRMDHQWIRDLIATCRESGTHPFVKQMGGLRPGDKLENLPPEFQVREWPRQLAVTS